MVKKDKAGLLDKMDLSTTCELVLHSLTLKGLFWQLKMSVKSQLPETHRHYKVRFFFNEEDAIEAVARINRELSDGLFEGEEISKTEAKKQIKRIEAQLEKDRELCEPIDFVGTVLAMKYTPEGTQVEMQIPDTVIEAINRQKNRLNRQYKVQLDPATI